MEVLSCRPGRFFSCVHNCIAFNPILIPSISFSEFIIDSTILSDNQYYLHHLYHFLAPAVGNISQWLLCYRQSSDGDHDTEFHKKCDGKQNTVTIVKVKEFVFGGYTDIHWGIAMTVSFKFILSESVVHYMSHHAHDIDTFMPVCLSVCLS